EAAGFAGAKATIDFYKAQGLSAIPERGANAAVTVPGAIGGWQLVLEVSKALGGKVPVSRLLEAATTIAKNGSPVTRLMEELLADRVADLDAPGFRNTYWPGGKRPKTGDTLKPDRLGATFERLASAGLDDFYRGDIGREIAADLEKIGSPVTRADLEKYRAVFREPIKDKLTSAALEKEAKKIDPKKAAPWPQPAGAGDTIWLGAVDSSGLAASYIQS